VHGSTAHDKNISLIVKCSHSIKKQTSYVITNIVKTKENRTNFCHRKTSVINAIDRMVQSVKSIIELFRVDFLARRCVNLKSQITEPKLQHIYKIHLA